MQPGMLMYFCKKYKIYETIAINVGGNSLHVHERCRPESGE